MTGRTTPSGSGLVCVIVQPIEGSGIGLLRGAGLEVREAAAPDVATLAPLLSDADAVVTRNAGFPAEAIAAAPRLKVIAAHGTGVDRIHHAAAAARGIRVVNTPGTNARSVAEHALALILAAARSIPSADTAVRAGDFGFRERVGGIELAGRCLGLWGFGAVGQHLAEIAMGLGMRVLVYSAHADADELAARGLSKVGSSDELLAAVDILSLHGVPTGAPLLDSAAFARMRSGAILVNTARGGLVDDAALAEALRNGTLHAAALDVFAEEPLPPDSPLLSAPNLILTPHIAGSTAEARSRTSLAVAEAVLDALGVARP